jgi:hypothetical protein
MSWHLGSHHLGSVRMQCVLVYAEMQGHIAWQQSHSCLSHVLSALRRCLYLQVGRKMLAGSSLLRSGPTQVGEPKTGEHAQ